MWVTGVADVGVDTVQAATATVSVAPIWNHVPLVGVQFFIVFDNPFCDWVFCLLVKFVCLFVYNSQYIYAADIRAVWLFFMAWCVNYSVSGDFFAVRSDA